MDGFCGGRKGPGIDLATLHFLAATVPCCVTNSTLSCPLQFCEPPSDFWPRRNACVWVLQDWESGRGRQMHFSNMRLMGVLVIAGLALAALPARAAFDSGLINVDFNGGTPLSPTYSGAAVVGSAGDTWNAFGGP